MIGKRWRPLSAVLLPIALCAAQQDERISGESFLDGSASMGAVVFADEIESVPIRVILDGSGRETGFLYLGEAGEPVPVRDGDIVSLVCPAGAFKVVPIRLAAGDWELRSSVAVYPSEGEGVLIHAALSFESYLNTKAQVPVRMKPDSDEPIRYSSRWASGTFVRVIAYRADEYGKPGVSGIVLVDRPAGGEGHVSLANLSASLDPGEYVFVHDDGTEELTNRVRILGGGLILIFR